MKKWIIEKKKILNLGHLTKIKKLILFNILYIFVLLWLIILFQIFNKKNKCSKNFDNNFIIKSDNDSLEEQILKE